MTRLALLSEQGARAFRFLTWARKDSHIDKLNIAHAQPLVRLTLPASEEEGHAVNRVAWAVAAAAVLLLGSVAFCGDVATVPMGNLMPDTNIEYNYIFVQPQGGAPVHWAEVFYGIEDRLEIGFHAVQPAGGPLSIEMTANWTAITETDDRPSVNIGFYNPNGANIGGSTLFSPYIVAAYNIREQHGPPHFSDPIIRGHLGYGWGRHGNMFFGAIQAQVGHRLGLVVANYQGRMMYAANITVGHTHPVQITPGVLNGAPFLRLGYQREL